MERNNQHIVCGSSPAVSVIVAAYNAEETIGAAIESVLSQEFRDLELIVVDDDSTDGTAAVVQRYVASDARVRYLKQTPRAGGPGPTRNTGIRASRGRYIAFLDDDDLWLPGKLAKQVSYLEAHPETALCFTQMYADCGDGRRTVWPWDDLRYSYLQLFRGNVVPILTVLVRRECVEAVGGFCNDTTVSADVDIWLRLGQRYQFHFVPVPTAVWYLRSTSTSHKRVYVQRGILKAVERVPVNEELGVTGWLKRRRVAQERYSLAQALAEAGRYREAIGHVLRVIITDPGIGEDLGERHDDSVLARQMQPYRLLGRCLVDVVTGRQVSVLPEGAVMVGVAGTRGGCLERQAEGAGRSTQAVDSAGTLKRSVKPVRVLYANPNVCLFGAERVLLNLLAHLDRSRFEPMVLLPEEGALSEAVRAMEVPVLINAAARPLRRASVARAVISWQRLARLLRRYQVDIFHLNLWSPYSDIAVVAGAAWAAGASFVVHIQNNMIRSSSYLEPYERFCFAQADQAICVTRFVERSLLAHTPGRHFQVHQARTCVIPGGFATEADRLDADRLAALRASLGIPLEAPAAAVVAGLAQLKNQEVFLRAAVLVRRQLPQAQFLLIGAPYGEDTTYADFLRRLAGELGLDGSVQFLGYRSDVPALMQMIDLLVLPSRTEALGGVLVEAMMAGKPVVAAAVDGIPEVVLGGETGLLVAENSPERYAEAMVRLLSDRELARRFGERGRAWASERFDAERVARQVEAVYDGLHRRSRWERGRLVATAAALRGLARWL